MNNKDKIENGFLPDSLDRDIIISWSILFIAALFRFFALSLKPPHGDEGVNGFFVIQMWENGYFSYDPTNYHGPLLFYLLQLSEKIFGFGIHAYRIVTATFSLLTIWLVLQLRQVLGRYGSYAAALALAVSPGMIFFGRSAIHEPLFVFFQIMWFAGFMKLREHMDQQGLRWFLLGILGCLLLKETFVIFGISFMVAWGWLEVSGKITGIFGRTVEATPVRKAPEFSRTYLISLTFVLIVLWLAIFTGFFQHMKGAKDFFVALVPWLKTGVGGAGHNKPFTHWFVLAKHYEWFGLVGLAGAFIGMVSRSWILRFLSAFALVNGLIYSLIPYKTPWCIISILWPFVFIAGLGVEIVAREIKISPSLNPSPQGRETIYPSPLEGEGWVRGIFETMTDNGRFVVSTARLFSVLLLFFAVVFLAGRSAVAAYTLNFVQYSDPSPYVYVQVKKPYKDLEAIVQKKIGSSPNFQNMIVQSNLNESWPLPWFFSRFPNYRFNTPQDPFDLNADVILAEVNRSDRELSELYVRRRVDMRESRERMNIYLKKSTFQGIALPGFEAFQPEIKGL